jgi:hypothetical protein
MISSFPCPTTTSARVTSAEKHASRIHSSIGFPQTSCSGLGRLDFIRVDFPAAKMIAVKLMIAKFRRDNRRDNFRYHFPYDANSS